MSEQVPQDQNLPGNNLLGNNPLGKDTVYPDSYSPELLFAIPRTECRNTLGVEPESWPFYGEDIWTAYELSWLDLKGKPQVRIGEIRIAADSINLVESKSLKLYLNSYNQESFESETVVVEQIKHDLENCVQGAVELSFWSLDEPQTLSILPGLCIDELDIPCNHSHPDATLLKTADQMVSEQLYSHLLKSNCPVTGQPDWATLWISYTGPQIDHESLLHYLVSYRCHQDYHENCVERIYTDIMSGCKPLALQVYARYTRRGGLDINPYRSSGARQKPPVGRVSRQ